MSPRGNLPIMGVLLLLILAAGVFGVIDEIFNWF